MKKFIVGASLVVLFIAGLSVLLYPAVSDYINSQSQSRVISQFNAELVKLSETDYSGIIDKAKAYNESLLNNPDRFMPTDADLKEYHSILDFSGTGVIGTVEIPEIKVKLPIYLGTDDSVLQVGIGHLAGSSLPIGGPGTHSVLCGHRGLPSSTLLTNADQLKLGDTFTLKILNETLTYQVDNIVIVLPEDMSALAIDPSKDYCTLSTCTPYGINDHRLLIRGIRIFPDDTQSPKLSSIFADASRAGTMTGYLISAAPVILVSLIYTLVRNITSKKRKEVMTGL
ncbi:MAG: class C sortase [Oscillospiraceae bacterium]|nr:class C sortase [Oscillospiraceae bacterium]